MEKLHNVVLGTKAARSVQRVRDHVWFCFNLKRLVELLISSVGISHNTNHRSPAELRPFEFRLFSQPSNNSSFFIPERCQVVSVDTCHLLVMANKTKHIQITLHLCIYFIHFCCFPFFYPSPTQWKKSSVQCKHLTSKPALTFDFYVLSFSSFHAIVNMLVTLVYEQNPSMKRYILKTISWMFHAGSLSLILPDRKEECFCIVVDFFIMSISVSWG